MEAYIIKSICCLLILYTFYIIFLENEKQHSFKRYFLILILIFSLTLPFITISYEVQELSTASFSETVSQLDSPNSNSEIGTKNYFPDFLWIIYAIGVAFFLVRFLRNILKLKSSINNNEKEVNKFSTRVLIPFATIPYSYFKYIFLDKDRYLENKIPGEVIQHEEAHVRQAHTIDLFILEILQIIFWFNPVVYFLKRSIRLNHEFLADEAVLKQNADPVSYSNLIINSSRDLHQFSLTSPFKHSLIKKRIIMISNQFSRKLFFSKVGLLIPVLCLCIYFFNNDIVARTSPGEKVPATTSLQQDYLFFIEVEGETIRLNGKHVKLQNFSKELDNSVSKYSKDEIRNKNIRLRLSNIPDDFAEKLNREYKKSKYFELNPSEEGLFPETPPTPTKQEWKVPKPPKAPKVNKTEAPQVPEAPKEPIIIEVREVPKAPKEPVIIEVREVSEPPEAPEEPVVIEVIEHREIMEKRMKIREEHLLKREKQLELREKELQERQLEFENRKQKMLERRKNNGDQKS
ncbi:M56 family metallopeptidase [Salegentibacter salegens]|uniref:Signal transducer regulating beta-lactamase production, contains metallopeptidase domain n=1 Tax=Salegentibacter salegens TaxID=143223 RepID=A0A1M7LDF0_9FLAO|nr:M56 family metallopeptidase [Salegentibacter salegens]PRX50624.1 beta-lactamase regulating signal transducer with metallopeptidase domain [Salegentibacter salegens]SHM76189.1 Signal transducer regulating beta-lactamase production, contains metallopeptidase domain [Salegentibacter salegens]